MIETSTKHSKPWNCSVR